MVRTKVLPASAPLRILIANNDAGDRALVRRFLSQAGFLFEYVEAATVARAVAACDAYTFDCAFIGYRMPDFDGLEGIDLLHRRLPFLSIIMMTADGNETIATEAMKRGASDYIVKTSLTALSTKRIVTRALERETLRRVIAAQREGLENFASVLAHDLKGPVASIQLFVSTICEDLQADVPDREEIFELCKSAVEAAQRVAALIDAVHSYTNTDAVSAFTKVDMRLIVNGAIINLAALIKDRGAQITFGELPFIVGDPSLLLQLLQNLFENAIKYCTLQPPKVHLSAVKSVDNDWQFSVADNGIGIAEGQQVKVFEPFTRLNAEGEYEGSGLGLATCRKVVERHGGSIWCQSSGVGKGSTFLFELHGLTEIYHGKTALRPLASLSAFHRKDT